MVIYDLTCPAGHRFEGWFRQADEYQTQQQQGLLSCPQCGSDHISKLPTASRIQVGRKHAALKTLSESEESPLEQLRRFVAERFDDVGERFPEEARRIHYGEAEARDICGTASAQEARELLDEGVSIIPLPGSVAKKDLN
jgi:hypothetical protein